MDNLYRNIFEDTMKRVDKLMADTKKRAEAIQNSVKERNINADEQDGKELEHPCDCGS